MVIVDMLRNINLTLCLGKLFRLQVCGIFMFRNSYARAKYSFDISR